MVILIYRTDIINANTSICEDRWMFFVELYYYYYYFIILYNIIPKEGCSGISKVFCEVPKTKIKVGNSSLT